MSPVRYGVVGCGRVFQRLHLPCVVERTDVELVAACDADPSLARSTLGDRDGVLITSDLDEFLAQRLDIVAVCTPNDAHTAPVLTAIAAGAAVLCEKPLAANLDEARRIAEAATPRVGVNLPYRFHELLPRLRDALPDGELSIELEYRTSGLRLWRPMTRWYDDRARAGGGALLDLGPHALNLLETVFGRPTLEACRVDTPGLEEHAELDLVFPAGRARLRVDRAARIGGVTLTVRSPGDTLTLDLRRGELRRSDEILATATDSRPELAAVNQFLDAMTGRGGAIVPAADALRVQELVASAYAAATPDPALAG